MYRSNSPIEIISVGKQIDKDAGTKSIENHPKFPNNITKKAINVVAIDINKKISTLIVNPVGRNFNRIKGRQKNTKMRIAMSVKIGFSDELRIALFKKYLDTL